MHEDSTAGLPTPTWPRRRGYGAAVVATLLPVVGFVAAGPPFGVWLFYGSVAIFSFGTAFFAAVALHHRRRRRPVNLQDAVDISGALAASTFSFALAMVSSGRSSSSNDVAVMFVFLSAYLWLMAWAAFRRAHRRQRYLWDVHDEEREADHLRSRVRRLEQALAASDAELAESRRAHRETVESLRALTTSIDALGARRSWSTGLVAGVRGWLR